MVQGHFNDLELDSRQEPCSSSPLVVGKFWRRRTRQNNNFALATIYNQAMPVPWLQARKLQNISHPRE